mmetsp:Transcript_124182/g.356765  ORF Transcript_124182/g.356765 Transcript_124182/m.356765 type:complete len:205 (+) Transcript_124182:211-825(+)
MRPRSPQGCSNRKLLYMAPQVRVHRPHMVCARHVDKHIGVEFANARGNVMHSGRPRSASRAPMQSRTSRRPRRRGSPPAAARPLARRRRRGGTRRHRASRRGGRRPRRRNIDTCPRCRRRPQLRNSNGTTPRSHPFATWARRGCRSPAARAPSRRSPRPRPAARRGTSTAATPPGRPPRARGSSAAPPPAPPRRMRRPPATHVH